MILTGTIIIGIFTNLFWKFGYIKKKTLCFILGALMFSLIALRSLTTGGDTQIYYLNFQSIIGKDLPIVFTESRMKDMGYVLFTWLIMKAGGNFRIILISCGLIFGYAMGKYFYKHSDNPGLSFVILFSFNIIQFSVSAVRQTFAIGLIILALLMYEDKKYIKSGVLYLIAGTFHLSAYILLVILLLKYILKTKERVMFSALFILVCFVFRSRIAVLLTGVFSSLTDRMEMEFNSSGGFTTSLVVLIVYLISVFFAKNYFYKYKDCQLEYALMLFATFFELLVTSQPIYFRVAFYSLWIIAIMIPRIIAIAFVKRSRFFVTMCAYFVALIMYFGFTMNSIVGGYSFYFI